MLWEDVCLYIICKETAMSQKNFYGISAIVSIIAIGVASLTYFIVRPQSSILLILCLVSVLLGAVGTIGCGLLYLSARKNNSITFDKK